jgi:hypothetical protein
MTVNTTISETDPAAMRIELERAQDEFYRTVTAFTISCEREGTGAECYQLAIRYSEAIDRYIENLASQHPTWTVLRERQSANDWKSILANDLEYLAKFRPSHPDLNASNGEEPAGNRGHILPESASVNLLIDS